jgi:hypothetical protein
MFRPNGGGPGALSGVFRRQDTEYRAHSVS